MATNLKEMMDAANAAVPRITAAQAREMIAQGNTLVVDVREPPEVEHAQRQGSQRHGAMSAFTTSAASRTGSIAAARWRSERRFRGGADRQGCRRRKRLAQLFGISRRSGLALARQEFCQGQERDRLLRLMTQSGHCEAPASGKML